MREGGREDVSPYVHVTSNVELRNNVRLLLNVELRNYVISVRLLFRGGPCQHGFVCGCKQWSNDINESN